MKIVQPDNLLNSTDNALLFYFPFATYGTKERTRTAETITTIGTTETSDPLLPTFTPFS